jgi:hypothetical protein
MSHSEIVGDMTIYQHLSSFLPELIENYFRVADNPGTTPLMDTGAFVVTDPVKR